MNLTPALLPTARPQHASQLAREALAQGADLVLALGGDGTINEIVNGMIGSRVPLGILPGGTANVLANELGFGNRVEHAVTCLGRAQPRRISLGRLRDAQGTSRHFLLMGGVGLDAAIVAAVNPRLKAATGKLAYWVAGLGQFFKRVAQFDVTLNGETSRCGFVLAARVRNYGGDLEIASGASLLHDDFEVVLFRGSSPLRYAAYMAVVGIKQVQKMPGVRTLHTTRVDFSGGAHVQIDGEYAGVQAVTFEIVPDALTLLAPVSYR